MRFAAEVDRARSACLPGAIGWVTVPMLSLIAGLVVFGG